MKKINALVLGVGGNVSQGIVKALRAIKNIDITVFGACISTQSVGLYMCDYAAISPMATDLGFVDWCIDYCNHNRIDIVFTGVEENILALLSDIERLRMETNAVFVLPTKEACYLGSDKYFTTEWLEKHGCNYPNTICTNNIEEAAVFFHRHNENVIVKPRTGKSSSGVYHIQKIEQFQLLDDMNNCVIQECIGSEESEFTVGCYFDRSGKLVSHIILHRYLKDGGTSICEVVQNQMITTEIMRVASKIDARGPLNVQLRIDDNGRPVIFEWNVRFSGTTAIRNHFGFCDVEAAIREYLFNEDPVNCFANQATSGTAVRYDEEMYFDGLQFQVVKERYLGK